LQQRLSGAAASLSLACLAFLRLLLSSLPCPAIISTEACMLVWSKGDGDGCVYASQMGLDPPKKVVHTIVGRPGNLVLEDNQFASDASDAKQHHSESLQHDSESLQHARNVQNCKDLVEREKEEDLVGIGLLLNVTSKGEVVVVALMVGHAAQMGGVEVGDLILTVDSAPVWLPEVCAWPARAANYFFLASACMRADSDPDEGASDEA
jgi:hypothetical protein